MRGGRLYLIAAACLVPASSFVAVPARGQDWEIIEAPLVMPVASAGEKDRSNDKDKRYRINLTEHGEILYKGKQYSLAELAKLLNGLKKRYGKFKDFGKRPYQVKTSELFLLFRVDRDAPWGHVQWLRKTATEARFYKFQYGVKLHADRTYTKEEAERLGAAWEDRPAPKAGRLEGKLLCFEPIERLPGGDGLRVLHEFATTSRVHVEVVATKMGQRGWPDSKLRFRVPLEIKYRLTTQGQVPRTRG